MAATGATISPKPDTDVPGASANGWFQLAVPADGSQVSIKKIVPHVGDGNPVDIRDILKKLKSHKVTYGVDVDAIYALLKQVEDNQVPEEPVVIARSDVVQGKDGKLDWLIDGIESTGKTIIVLAGVTIATLCKADKGKPGKNVFGKSKQPRPVYDPQVTPGQGIKAEENDAGEIVYTSTIAGELKYEDDSLGIDSHVHVSDDHMQVTMDIPAGRVESVSRLVTAEDILGVLDANKITHGIIHENISSALVSQGEGPGLVKNISVALGREARDGVDAWLQVDERLAVGKLLLNGQIDFNEKSYPWNVKTDEVIGRVIPPVAEENGFTVMGKVIPAKPAEGLCLALDGIREETDGRLLAMRDGILLVNGTEISITDSLVVKGDVCHRTGNIDSDKTVIVKGYVEPGYVLQSKGDVIVDDNVEQSLVRANGCIVVKSGIRGSQSRIVSRGNINAGFIENARLRALGDITVEHSLVSCQTWCRGQLQVGRGSSKKSTLIGGDTFAEKGVVAANLGSEGCKLTAICVGGNANLLQDLKRIGEEISQLEQSVNKLQNLAVQYRHKQDQGENGEIRKIELSLQVKKQELAYLQNTRQALRTRIESARSARVVIQQHVYPGVRIQILDWHYEVRKKENAGTFFLQEELIIFRPTA